MLSVSILFYSALALRGDVIKENDHLPSAQIVAKHWNRLWNNNPGQVFLEHNGKKFQVVKAVSSSEQIEGKCTVYRTKAYRRINVQYYEKYNDICSYELSGDNTRYSHLLILGIPMSLDESSRHKEKIKKLIKLSTHKRDNDDKTHN